MGIFSNKQITDNSAADSSKLSGHMYVLAAYTLFGLMIPFSKDAINAGVSGTGFVACRLIGATVLFWLASLFVKTQKIDPKDLLSLILMSFFGMGSGMYLVIVGTSLTSPVHGSIIITTAPLFTLCFAFIFKSEKLSFRKITGVLSACIGAVILGLQAASGSNGSSVTGDLMILSAQFTFAVYLTFFVRLMRKYDSFTLNRWLFLFSSVMFLPLTAGGLADIPWQDLSPKTCFETLYIVVVCSFVTFILLLNGQKRVSPVIAGIYMYVQPVVGIAAAVFLGIGVFGIYQAAAVILVIGGIVLATFRKNSAAVMPEK